MSRPMVTLPNLSRSGTRSSTPTLPNLEPLWVANVLFVDDDPEALATLRETLFHCDCNWNTSYHRDVDDALQRLSRIEHAVVIVNRKLARADDGEFPKRIRTHLDDPQHPLCALQCVVVWPEGAQSEQIDIQSLGADDYLPEPCSLEQLIARVEVAGRSCRLVHDNVRLRESLLQNTTIDPLTRLTNRRGARERVECEMAKARRGNQEVVVALCHIDALQATCEKIDQSVGRFALQTFADVLRECLRQYDLAARWRGETFLLMFSDVDVERVTIIVERIRNMLEHRVVADGRMELDVGFSAGLISTQQFPEECFDDLLRRADWALRTAREAGTGMTVAAMRGDSPPSLAAGSEPHAEAGAAAS